MGEAGPVEVDARLVYARFVQSIILGNVTTMSRVSAGSRLASRVTVTNVSENVVTGKVRGDKNYIVTITSDGEYTCTCSDTAYRGFMCKHVLALVSYLLNTDEHPDGKRVAVGFAKSYTGNRRPLAFIPTGDPKLDALMH
jgi:hypothetical protein